MNAKLNDVDSIRPVVARVSRTLGGQWPILLSSVLMLVSVLIWSTANSEDEASRFATYISGVASTVALIWLIAGFRLQSRELCLQRQELELQRLAAEQQARELNNSARLGSLEQIRSLLEDAERCVRECPLSISSPTEIQKVYFERIVLWKTICESRIPADVSSAYQDWLPIEAVARNYVRYISSALIIYLQYNYPYVDIDRNKEPEDFVYIYQEWGRKAPFISHHIGTAALVAQFLWLMAPGLERIRLAWMVATVKGLGKNLIKEDALEDLRDKVLKHSSELPAICSPWPE